MQKILGLLMLGGGLAYIVTEIAPSSSEREEQLAAVSRIVARATILEPETVPAEHPGLRRPVASPAAHPVATVPSMAVANAPPAADAALPAVSIANEAAPRTPVTSATNSKPSVQRQLARQIQSELKRVGCYSGRLDGSWGDRSRSAMANFIARVNASLPTNEPDVFLLSLIKGQTQAVCGPACGGDEVLSGGRCVAQTVVAESSDDDTGSADERPRQLSPPATIRFPAACRSAARLPRNPASQHQSQKRRCPQPNPCPGNKAIRRRSPRARWQHSSRMTRRSSIPRRCRPKR